MTKPCIVRTRIPAGVSVRARQIGASEADVPRSDPSPGTEDLVHVWVCYESYRDESDRQVRENDAA